MFTRARLVHDGCGHEVTLGYDCAAWGTRVRGGAVALRRPAAARDGRARRPRP